MIVVSISFICSALSRKALSEEISLLRERPLEVSVCKLRKSLCKNKIYHYLIYLKFYSNDSSCRSHRTPHGRYIDSHDEYTAFRLYVHIVADNYFRRLCEQMFDCLEDTRTRILISSTVEYNRSERLFVITIHIIFWRVLRELAGRRRQRYSSESIH